MRALGSAGRVITLPDWVSLSPPAPPEHHWPRARCARCGKDEPLYGGKPDAARALGSFATRHRRCPDPALIEAAVAQAPLDRARAAERDAWFARQRAAGHVWQPRRK